jgi:hypothetical protein
MSVLDDRATSSGLTRRPVPAPLLPGVRAAQDFLVGREEPLRRRLLINVDSSHGTKRPWFIEHMEQELNRLVPLGEGWDGRRARPLDERAIRSVVFLLAVLLTDDIAPAQFFPLPDGGVQAEWHFDRHSVEIEVDADGEAHVLATSPTGDVVLEGTLNASDRDEALLAVRRLLRELSSRVHTRS